MRMATAMAKMGVSAERTSLASALLTRAEGEAGGGARGGHARLPRSAKSGPATARPRQGRPAQSVTMTGWGFE